MGNGATVAPKYVHFDDKSSNFDIFKNCIKLKKLMCMLLSITRQTQKYTFFLNLPSSSLKISRNVIQDGRHYEYLTLKRKN